MGSDRSAATRRRLCLAAEALVARSGLEAVTLRTVAAAAGQRNTAAVSYHFGSLKNLLRAVVEMRVLDEEPERRRLVELLTGDPKSKNVVLRSIRPLCKHMFVSLLGLGNPRVA